MADTRLFNYQMTAGVHDAKNLDIISNLPDPILCNILSLIPTKSAVATSILSRRWKFVWTKVPVLDFSEMPYLGSCCSLGLREQLFKRFVDRVLHLNEVSYVELVRLHFFHGIDVPRVDAWLAAIMRRDIKEIDLKCHCSIEMKLPPQIFSREKLVVLKLESSKLDVPVSVNLPSLEIFYIIRGSFQNGETLKNLLSGCPVLKELFVDGCKGLCKLYVSSSSLRRLELRDNADGCQNDSIDSITIEGLNLEYLYISDIAMHYDFSGLPCLDKAVVSINGRGISHREKSVELLRGICGLKSLKLGKPTAEILQDIVLSKLPAFRNINLPVFSNLVCLEIAVSNWTTIMHLLECTPKLVSLFLYNNSQSRSEFNPLPAVPKCLVLSLEEVVIDYLSWGEGDLLLVGYLLKNATVLKKMKLHMVPYTCPVENTGTAEKLRQLFCISRGCKITIC